MYYYYTPEKMRAESIFLEEILSDMGTISGYYTVEKSPEKYRMTRVV